MIFDDPRISLTDEETAAVEFLGSDSKDAALTVAVVAEMKAREYVKHALDIYRAHLAIVKDEVARALR